MVTQAEINLASARATLEKTGLYHSFRLPDGRILAGVHPIETLEQRLTAYDLPANLTGKRVLDIGPWDGYFTFELERRGAEVTAIDYVDLDTFRTLHRLLGSKAQYRQMDVYELDPAELGTFDIVLCLGVLYHLKHPLLALEKICAVCRDLCIVDTFVVDPENWATDPAKPQMFFYERDEFCGQIDNWIGPTTSMVPALCRAAGFASAALTGVTGSSARVIARRKWPVSAMSDRDTVILGVTSHRHRGKTFQSTKEEYFQIWCRWEDSETPPLTEIEIDVDGFGVPPIAASLTNGTLLVNARVPPGIASGTHQLTIRPGTARWSHSAMFYVDLPAPPAAPLIENLQDGLDWSIGEVTWTSADASEAWLTVWAYHLTREADPGNTIVFIGNIPHHPETVDASTGQINVRLRPLIHAGEHDVRVSHRGAVSEPVNLRVAGRAPAVCGI